MRTIKLLVVSCIGVLAAACGPQEKLFQMIAQGSSGEGGKGQIFDLVSSIEVDITLTPGADTGDQPAEIDNVPCNNPPFCDCSAPGPLLVNLNPVVSGKSSTSLSSVKFTQLGGKLFVIHVQKSDGSSLVSCGNIP